MILATRPDFVGTASNASPTEFQAGRFQEHLAQAGQVDWQTAMKRAIRKRSVLNELLRLPESTSANPSASATVAGEKQFPTFVPLEFVRRIVPGDPLDPLLLQVLPVEQESDHSDPRFLVDPVGDQAASVANGLLHKYAGRTLVITTGACGVHCRYCFRREFPYADNRASDLFDSNSSVIRYLRRSTDVHEVILSGGDPLTWVDATLFRLIEQIESIPHVRRLRIHSRMPVVIPQRVTETLIRRLSDSRLAAWMVIHANHPAELDEQVLDRINAMVNSGIPVLNQAVLLRGVNDDADALAELCEKLIDVSAMPYYLHQLDRVRGAAHFEVPVQRGIELVESLRQRLPGYAVPKFVVEQAGKGSKTPLESASISDNQNGLGGESRV